MKEIEKMQELLRNFNSMKEEATKQIKSKQTIVETELKQIWKNIFDDLSEMYNVWKEVGGTKCFSMTYYVGDMKKYIIGYDCRYRFIHFFIGNNWYAYESYQDISYDMLVKVSDLLLNYESKYKKYFAEQFTNLVQIELENQLNKYKRDLEIVNKALELINKHN